MCVVPPLECLAVRAPRRCSEQTSRAGSFRDTAVVFRGS